MELKGGHVAVADCRDELLAVIGGGQFPLFGNIDGRTVVGVDKIEFLPLVVVEQRAFFVQSDAVPADVGHRESGL